MEARYVAVYATKYNFSHACFEHANQRDFPHTLGRAVMTACCLRALVNNFSLKAMGNGHAS